MKTKFYLFIFVIATTVFCSCTGNDPSQSDMQKYQAELLRYYPYISGDTCIFKNEEQNQTFVLVPQKAYTHITICGAFDKCSFDKSLEVKGLWNKTGDNIGAYFIADVEHPRGSDKLECVYTYRIFMDSKEEYSGCTRFECLIDELLSQFPDTLVLPIDKLELDYKPFDVEGAYIRLVKDQGLTDFSVDGTTVWRRN